MEILNRESARHALRWGSIIGLIVSIASGVLTFVIDGLPLAMFIVLTACIIPGAFFSVAASISEREQHCSPAHQPMVSAPKALRLVGVLIAIAFVVSLADGARVVGDKSDPSAGIPSRSEDKYFVANRGPKQEVSKEVYYRSLERIERSLVPVSSWFYWVTLVTVIYMSDRPIILKKRR